MQVLTVKNIAELVTTSSNKLTQRRIEPDLSHDAVKLALIDYYEGFIKPEEIERDAIIDEVKLIDGRVHITWYGYLPVDMKICIQVAIERYIEITKTTVDEVEIPVVPPSSVASDETLDAIVNLKDEFENFIPFYEIRNRLTHLTKEEQDEALYQLERSDRIPDRKLGHNCSANALPPGALYSLTISYSLTTNSYR